MHEREAPRPGRPRSAETDRAVLEAALDLFIEGGVEAVKTETVAKRSGVTRATVYRRYPRREDLVIAAVAEAYRAHLEQPAPEHPTLAETVAGIAGALADARVRRVLRRLMSVPHEHPELFAEYRAVTGAPDRDEIIHQVLEKESDCGNFPAHGDLEMVQTLFAASISTHLLTRPDDEPAEQIVAFLYRVLAALGHHQSADDTSKES
ncbi:TetR/AcrR family transcriptional regulator [Brachybacterium sp. FME24]|uniref:TetR/AcrR family transcriptional regulator n=1 Tax=Brachybacterium sp. FME24 TaxID=2742605 RepID=UPI0018693D15|nr:TetR/AcrR family transcriptional regulator [Brachybacterium sp. FME24]